MNQQNEFDKLEVTLNIFIDESGSFVSANHAESWNAVAALVAPETARKEIESIVNRARSSRHNQILQEIKLREINEDQYFEFLYQLGRLPIALFCVATDARLNSLVRWARFCAHAAIHQMVGTACPPYDFKF